jgi:hypothetical protein
MKKVLLLVVALAALALPASASAYSTWTENGEGIAEGNEFSQTYTVQKHSYFPYWPSYDRIRCQVSIQITATGGEVPSLTTARISQFNEQPGTCETAGLFVNCDISNPKNNIAEGWNVSHGSPMLVENAGGESIIMSRKIVDVEPHECYYPGKSGQTYQIPLEFIPTVNGEGEITEVMLKGLTEQGVQYDWGPFVVDGTPELGLK